MPYLNLDNSKRLHYRDIQPTSSASPRETFIFTHGLGSTQNYYAPILSAFTEESFRCITFDTTGSGRSPPTHSYVQTVQTLSDDVIALMDFLNVEKAVLVGHSMGCLTAANLAITKPERIVASVWIGPVYPGAQLTEVFGTRMATVREKGMEAMADTIPSAAVGSGASEVCKAMIRELLLGQSVEGYCGNCRVIKEAEAPKYEDITIPILIVAGEEDKSAPLEGCKKMFEQLPGEEKKMVVLEEVGHWHCLEAPEEVSEEILNFYHEIQ